MYYDACQFGPFDSRENRQTVYELFVRMGKGLPEFRARVERAGFLRGLLKLSGNGFDCKLAEIEPCSAVEAYRWFNAITGAFGVGAEEAAVLLERVIKRMETKRNGVVIG